MLEKLRSARSSTPVSPEIPRESTLVARHRNLGSRESVKSVERILFQNRSEIATRNFTAARSSTVRGRREDDSAREAPTDRRGKHPCGSRTIQPRAESRPFEIE